jgi:signal transduction histidine kinase/ActR/RegA family two-component response regulator
MRLPSLSLRVQLLLTFAGLAAGSAAVVGAFAYRSALAGMERDARRSVAAAALNREETITRLLTFRQRRAEGFLTSVTSSCGEIGPKGRIGWEIGCVDTALEEFRFTEGAAAARLMYGSRQLAQSGRWTPVRLPNPGTLARLVPGEGDRLDFVMYAQSGIITVMLRFTTDEIAEIFRSHYGLGASGEVFLTDADGRLVTPVRYMPEQSGTARAAAGERQVTGGCVAGRTEQIVAPDYRGIKTIHGLRSISAFGGVGCIDAHVMYDEALAPMEAMREQMLYRGAGFLGGAMLLSLIASAWIERPIRHLVASARALQDGRFDATVRVAGPSEIRELESAFGAMRAAIRDLLASEQIARLQAESANRAKDDFLAVVSHELRTPLTSIIGWSHLVNTGKLDAAHTVRALQTIERSAEAQSRLVDDLLDVSRIASGTLRLNRSRVTIVSAVDAAIDAMRPRAEKHGVELSADIDRYAGFVYADPQRLQQIVDNLVSNALKFTPEGGRVNVAVRRSGGDIELSVRDTGVGISAEFLPHVFDRFRQADGASTRTHGGLGLGLAIVKHLVEMHGGSVRAASAGPGQGSTFVVTLPAAEAEVAAVGDTLHVAGSMDRRLAHVNVLVVDDDGPTREVVSTILTSAGASVTTVGSAAEARDAMAKAQPAVVVADIAMPAEDGLALMRSLRQAGTTADDVPAIALTALTRSTDVDAALAAGFQAHLPKPVNVNQLVNTVAALAARRAA